MLLSTPTGTIGEKVGLETAVRLIAEAGFDAFDLSMYHMATNGSLLNGAFDRTTLKRLKQTAQEVGIVCNQAHAPFPAQLHGDEQFNKIAFDSLVRAMEYAVCLGAGIIVVHPLKEYSTSAPAWSHPKPYESREEMFEENMAFYGRLLPYAEEYGIKIAIENMWCRHPHHYPSALPGTCGLSDEFCRYIDALNSPHIVACLDVGHALICGEEPDHAARQLGQKRLQALHIHDNNGYEDNHALPYGMAINWEKFLTALGEIGYQGDFTFEADGFLKNYPKEWYPAALSYMAQLGRFMMKSIPNNKII